jgi:hypothetical protein
MPEARAPATLLATEVQVGGRPQRAIGQLTPQRLIDADAVAAGRAQQKRFCHHPPKQPSRCLPRIASTLRRAGPRPIRGTPPAFCGRLLKRFVSAPVRTHQRALPRATDCLRLLPPSPRIRHHAAPSPHSITARSSGGQRPPPLQGTACSRDRRPQTADGRRCKARRRTVRRNALDPPSEVETPGNPALKCPSPRRRKSRAHASRSGGRFPLFKPGTRRTDRDQRLKMLVMSN